jgi:hypothetical protein
MPYNFSEEEKRFRELLFIPCKTAEEVKQWCLVFLDIELPDTCVDPESNSNMLDMVYTCYSHIIYGPKNEDETRYLWFSSRFGGKTLCESIIEVMLLLHSRIDITHLAAIERQSRDCQKYIAKFFNLPYLKGILSGDSKKEKVATFFVPNAGGVNLTEKEWKTLSESEKVQYIKVSNTVEVIVATLASTNGKHTALLCLDEIDVMSNEEAYKESANIPTPSQRPDGSLVAPLTLLTSTRKFAFGLVAREINKAEKTKDSEGRLIIKHWNILDVCQACPKNRHLPELPKQDMFVAESLLAQATPQEFTLLLDKEKEKYVKIKCFTGCVKNCKMLPACKTYLATRQTSTSKFLKPITYIQNQIKVNDVDRALAQLLCRKPSSEGLIYPKFSKEKHQLSPAQAYERIFAEECSLNLTKDELVAAIKEKGEWFAGIDWGFSHLFAFVLGIRLGNTFYVIHAFGQSDLAPAEKIDAVEKYKEFAPKVWADTEDPGQIKAFRQAGWRMAKWKKGKIEEGFSYVRLKLMPTMGQDPELFFVRDVGEDPMMDLLLLHLREHHYKIADGKVTDTPSDEDKDFPDAVRYLIHNLFEIKGKVTVTEDAVKKEAPRSSDGSMVYHQDTWLQQKIQELTGEEGWTPQKSTPAMTVEEIPSYYAQQNKKEEEGRKGNKRGIVWDFS